MQCHISCVHQEGKTTELYSITCLCRLEDGDFPLLSNSRTFPHLIVSLSELKALAFNDEQEKVVNKVGHGIVKQNVRFKRRRM